MEINGTCSGMMKDHTCGLTTPSLARSWITSTLEALANDKETFQGNTTLQRRVSLKRFFVVRQGF